MRRRSRCAASRWRGSAISSRAKALLRSAARAFGPREAVARARCVVAEAEIALVSRDLGWPAKALDAARATLEAHGDCDQRRACAPSRSPAPAADRAPRRGRAKRSPSSTPRLCRRRGRPLTNWWLQESPFGACTAKAARAALARAERGAREAGIPALMAEVESALARPEHARRAPVLRAARSDCCCSRRSRRCWRRDALVVDACRHVVRERGAVVSLATRPVLVRARARVGRGVAGETRRGALSSRARSAASTPTNRIARGCGSRSAGFASNSGRWPRSARRSAASRWRRAARREVVVLAPPVEERHAAVLALLADGEVVVELGLGAGARRQPAHRAAGARCAGGRRQGAVVRSRAGAPLDDPAGAGIPDKLVTPAPAAGRLGSYGLG